MRDGSAEFAEMRCGDESWFAALFGFQFGLNFVAGLAMFSFDRLLTWPILAIVDYPVAEDYGATPRASPRPAWFVATA